MAKDTRIEHLVLKTLARTCKEKSIYPYIICSLCSSNSTLVGRIISNIKSYSNIREINSHDSPLVKCKTQDDVITKLYELRHRNGEESQTRATQFRVMDDVNNLLRCCLERTMKSGINIEDIGREAFENTCKKIFGEGFKDETDQAPNGVNGGLGRILERIASAKRNNNTELTNQAINDFIQALKENRHPFNPWEPEDEENRQHSLDPWGPKAEEEDDLLDDDFPF